MIRLLVALGCLLCGACSTVRAEKPFAIEVVDDATGRGVPLVELTTTNNIPFVTDSAGLVAFDEPGLMDQKVFFTVKSHGYEMEKDMFGFRGVALDVKPGGSATIKIKRLNIAERLYRVTGGGIYRDSILLGRKSPIKQPLLNSKILGLDSTQAAVYNGKIFWLWGDTNRPAYPLGNFFMTGATSLLPDKGGLDPNVGVNFDYFEDDEGFAKKMIPIKSEGNPVWILSLIVLPDDKGVERLAGYFIRVKTLGENLESGIAVFSDEKGIFEKVVDIPVDAVLGPFAQSVRAKTPEGDFIYFSHPYPNIRVKADWKSFLDISQYEALTPLAQGETFDGTNTKLDRKDGRIQWTWKRNTAALKSEEQQKLVDAGLMKLEDSPLALRNIDDGRPVLLHSCTVDWNEHRRKYVMIGLEMKAKESYIGEVWYAEAASPAGPWISAKKIVTHDHYSFYNPRRHVFFDQGRYIYFDGTYSNALNETVKPTPRYDYNLVMYRLDLDDPRLEGVRSGKVPPAYTGAPPAEQKSDR
jgi:hypothetical protein